MSSRSSPKDLAALVSGTRIFVDANIFIYHFTHTPLTAACTAFLQRVEIGDVQGVTSVATLTEAAHRLMILEAIQTHGLSARDAVRKLRENPALVRRLSHYKVAIEMTQSFNVVIEPITSALLRIAQGLSTSHGLLTNDSLIAAAMQSLVLIDLASNDPDLSVMPGLTVWRPQP